jgi:hypothetical protein
MACANLERWNRNTFAPRSRRRQRFFHGLRIARDDGQQSPRSLIGVVPFFLPIAHQRRAETKTRREFLLRQAKPLAYGGDIGGNARAGAISPLAMASASLALLMRSFPNLVIGVPFANLCAL